MLGLAFKALAESCYHALQAKALTQFQNNVKLLNNVLISEMLSPFAHQGSELWVHLAFICQLINEMLAELKTQWARANEKEEAGRMPEENKKEGGEYPVLNDTLTKDFWFKQRKEIDISTMANIIAYTVNSLFIEEKWDVLINIVRDFSNATLHFYSKNLLPFLIHAQNIKLAQAKAKTDAKKEELERRIEDYKKWEVSNPKAFLLYSP